MVSRALLAALAGTAAATYHPHQLNGVRSLHSSRNGNNDDDNLAARQDDDGGAFACQASVFAIISDIPQPTPALASYLSSFAATANPTDPALLCAVTSSMPTSLSSAYSSYDQAASSWFSEHSSEVAALASQCAGGDGAAQDLTDAITALESYTAADCTGPAPTGVAGLVSLFPGGGGSGSNATVTGGLTTPTPTPTGGSSQDDDSSSQTTTLEEAAAARPTGMIAGAMAAAGLIGAVVML